MSTFKLSLKNKSFKLFTSTCIPLVLCLSLNTFTSTSMANDSMTNKDNQALATSSLSSNAKIDTKERKVYDLNSIKSNYLLTKDYVKYFGPYLANNLFSLSNQVVFSPYSIGHVSTMDLQLVTKNVESLNPNLSASVGESPQANLGIFLPLISKNNISQQQKLDFIVNYYKAWNAYAAHPKYALALMDNDLSLAQLTNNLNTTFLFINQDQKVIHTPVLTSSIISQNNELLLKPNSTITVGVIDYNGVTNQSNLEITITNLSEQPQTFVSTLNSYLQIVMDNAKDLAQEKQLDHTFNPIYRDLNSQIKLAQQVLADQPADSTLDISSNNSNVQITGGKISAGSIHITSGKNIVISNSNLVANNIDINAKHQIDLSKNKFDTNNLVVKAPIIHSDQPLVTTLNHQVFSSKKYTNNYSLPRIMGINNYLVSLNNYTNRQFSSRPILPLSLIAAISNQTNSASIIQLWQENYQSYLDFANNFLSNFNSQDYINQIKFPFLASQYNFIEQNQASALGSINSK